jgi:hypothetical protein
MAVRDALKAPGMVTQLLDKCKHVNMGTEKDPVDFVQYLTNRMKANIVDMRGVRGAAEASKPMPVPGDRAEVSAALKEEAKAKGDGTSATGQATTAPAEPGKTEEITDADFERLGEE